jgi:plasmid maintenance system antidote protein VapI
MTEQEQSAESGIRLQTFINALNITGKAFSKTLNVAQSHISQICAGKRNLTMPMLYRITRRYPEINVLWLLFGEGNMLKDQEQTQSVEEPRVPYEKLRPIALEDLAAIIISIQDENAELRRRLERVERRLDDQDKTRLP